LGVQSQLVHTYAVDVSGKAQIKYYRGSKLQFGARYSNYQDYAYFTPPTAVMNNNTVVPFPIGTTYYNNHYHVNYQDAINLRLLAGLTQQLVPERFWLAAKIYVPHPELSNGEKIPYEEDWGIKASTTTRPIDMISIQGWANFTGK